MAKEHHHAAEHKPPPGVHDLTPPAAGKTGKAAPHTGFYHIRVYLPATPEPGAPDHVVAARDEIEAEARCYQELGIRSVDKSVNVVEITPVPESDYLKAQARRQGVDLRSQHDAEGKLTWAPADYKPTKTYYVSDTGELSETKEEK
jgi:hypothetical protein